MIDKKQLSTRRNQLSADKQALLEKRLRGKLVASNSKTAILHQTHSGAIPLSFAQERLWFLDQLQPGNPAYIIPIALHLSGNLNIDVLESSLNEIVNRHQSLRTTFVSSGDQFQNQPVQVIASAQHIALNIINLEYVSPDQLQAQIQQLTLEKIHEVFDLTRGPLLRANLLRIAEDEHILVLAIHHIVFDGWSMGLFFSELSQIYSAALQGQPASLPDLTIQYADFAVWQKEWLKGESLDEQLDYWKEQLLNQQNLLPPATQLSTDLPRPAIQSTRGALYHFSLPDLLSQTVASFSKSEGVTPFMTLLSAFFNLLHRYTGQDDLRIGTPIANRNRAEIEGLIGFFVNTLVLRSQLNDEMSFRQLLGQVRKTATEAYAHQDLPFERLVQSLNPSRDLGSHSLFQIMFVFQNRLLTSLDLPGLKSHPLPIDPGTAMFDLTFTLEETDHGLKGSCEYNLDLYEESTIQLLTEHYQTLLEAALNHPDQPLSLLDKRVEFARRNDFTVPVHFPQKNLQGVQFSPRTPLEDDVASVWAEILGLEKIGIEENFFELGGHSLLAIRLVSRLRSRLGIEVPLRSLFEFPTIAGLAAIIKTSMESQKLQSINEADNREEFIL